MPSRNSSDHSSLILFIAVFAAGLAVLGVLFFVKDSQPAFVNQPVVVAPLQVERVEIGATRTAEVALPKTEAPIERGIRYTLAEAGEVSAAVYDQDGKLVRTLLNALPQEAGTHILTWDGLNRLGEPMPPGEYTVKLLSKPPFRREFIMQVGVNPGSSPIHRWVGDFGGGTSVALDDSGMYISSRNAEGNFMLIKQSKDGTERMWERGDVDPWRGGLSLASDGKTVYVLQQNAFITLFDAATGEHTGRWDVLPESKVVEGQNFRERRGVVYTDHQTRLAGRDLANMDMAVAGSQRVITDERENEVRWLADDGSVVAKVSVPAPMGVAIAPDGAVYAISNKAVLHVTQNGRTQTVIRGLVNPWRLTYDPANDDLLVAEGHGDWRVKRFSKSGEFKRSYGREGGRLEGPYNPHDFYMFTDITADGDGGFFLAEPELPPRRIAHFNADGELIREWYGGLTFFSPSTIDPLDPTLVWYNSSCGGGMVMAQLDYDQATWSVQETYLISNKADGLGHASSGHSAQKVYVRYHEGERYLVFGTFPPSIFHHTEGRLEPVVIGNRSHHFPQPQAVARIMTGSDNEEDIGAWLDEHVRDASGAIHRKNNAYLWVDRNGDRIPQADEITIRRLGSFYIGPGMGAHVGKDFTVIAGSGDYNPNRNQEGETNFYSSIVRLRPNGWVDGVPQYTLPATAGELDVAPLPMQPNPYIGRANVRHTYQDSDGAIYAFYHWGEAGFGGFPNNQGGRSARLTKWSADGVEQWSVGRKATGATDSNRFWQPTAPGDIHYPTRVSGEIRGTIVVNDRVVNPAMVWTKDGLFAGSFFPGRVDDGLPDWVYNWQHDWTTNKHSLVNHDCLEGGSITEYNGDVYYLSPGCNSVVVYRVHGYEQENWVRQEHTIILEQVAPHARQEGTGLLTEVFSGIELSGQPAAVQTDVDPNTFTIPEEIDIANGASIRFSGWLEPMLSETYTVTAGGGGVRLWIDGKQVIDAWNTRPVLTSLPVELEAGQRVPIVIEYFSTSEKPASYLRWHSFSTDLNPVPVTSLYHERFETRPAYQPRPAIGEIHIGTFDHTITSDGIVFDTFHRRQHLNGLTSGRHLGYRRIDFGEGVSRVKFGLRDGVPASYHLEFRLGSPDGQVIANVEVIEFSSGYGIETVIEGEVAEVTGVHDVYLLTSVPRHGARLRWFRFE